ncbi:uncharacterized protein BO72DRAFT_271109 [Aspergillus fijiensis CBS 313.89]|uniref:Uncharacterized protein n=1 Tax=Aspergillus fijiensis CBS 313.89 TaxID=1448319 RepID=A0A8G1RI77_9EURO|nr:uncharacterized protein BO72DRAFT_271109 [Aspergillus fijiensis CBS 313.89]RAK72593.1 hypothetical protein BO72DRAFT_271109 [Aspergillus fijiensis CBS 313.89]
MAFESYKPSLCTLSSFNNGWSSRESVVSCLGSASPQAKPPGDSRPTRPSPLLFFFFSPFRLPLPFVSLGGCTVNQGLIPRFYPYWPVIKRTPGSRDLKAVWKLIAVHYSGGAPLGTVHPGARRPRKRPLSQRGPRSLQLSRGCPARGTIRSDSNLA